MVIIHKLISLNGAVVKHVLLSHESKPYQAQLLFPCAIQRPSLLKSTGWVHTH